MVMPSFLAAGFLLVALGQPPAPDSIASQLASPDLRTVAWGSYNASAYQRDDLIPRLQRLLETSTFRPTAFTDVVMDALIQLNARLPAQVLVPYIDKRPVQSFVLMARASDRDEVLLDLLPNATGDPWYAAADTLFEDRSPGLAEHLIRSVRLRLTVAVVDVDGSGFGGGNGGGGAACGIGQDLPGYPPHAEYRFEDAARPGFHVLAVGPHPVYYSRTLTRTFQYAVSKAITSGPTDQDRLSYLQAMLPDTGSMPLRAETHTTVRWTTGDALIGRIAQLKTEMAQRFHGLIEAVRQFLAIARDLSDPPIDVQLVDGRTDKAVPLPKLPPGQY